MNKTRLTLLRQTMKQSKAAALLVTDPYNRRYITGFTGTAGYVLITCSEAWLITDFRYIEQATEEAPLYDIVDHKGAVYDCIKSRLQSSGVDRLHFEKDAVVYGEYLRMNEALAPVELVPAEKNWIQELRMIKDEDEIAVIREAAKIADAAFSYILHVIRPGISEREVALELEHQMQQLGASGPSFETIVASGKRSSLPHGVASEKSIHAGDLVTLDFGARYKGYCSDITRTIAVGEVDPTLREIYQIVFEAQLHGLAVIQAGMSGKDADETVRSYIRSHGYGDYFGHGTGHGIGLDIHESPGLSRKDLTILKSGMVVTVEPGIYLPDLGGVRIEDDVYITEQGLEILTHSPKDWVVI